MKKDKEKVEKIKKEIRQIQHFVVVTDLDGTTYLDEAYIALIDFLADEYDLKDWVIEERKKNKI